MLSRFRNHKNKRKEGYFLKNGAVMLEQLIHSLMGNCNPIRMYSGKELKKATNDYSWDRMTHGDWNFQLYKGVHDDHEILVKKFEGDSNSFMDPLELITNEAAIASKMSKQKNIKLKIAVEVADAVAYLHYGTCKMFIHRHIKTEYIFLDQDYVAKLSEFQTSVPIPCGETHVDAEVFGAPHHSTPELKFMGVITRKERTLLIYKLFRSMGQVAECTKLALWCLESDPYDRLTMKEVSTRLRLIKRF
ncbi:unnamed protein product [Prunus armeniaca]|uniref:Protein kinase domain-containing protein n=1 Tax=Prunus armeniaca TaxID=36596 RepID=A0A6J5UAM1_PRUAR|nr:unnamed protein product [Prunus armeniaca]